MRNVKDWLTELKILHERRTEAPKISSHRCDGHIEISICCSCSPSDECQQARVSEVAITKISVQPHRSHSHKKKFTF